MAFLTDSRWEKVKKLGYMIIWFSGTGNSEWVAEQLASALGERMVSVAEALTGGEGVLRRALLDELKRKWPRCAVQDASFQEYGFGATQVTIKQ